ncbi:MAG: hypothetical protein KDD70_03230 [Bdellovibrionales bacterium]|nr:hypothetical protein [Bdellovibrionales bacterium]
MEDFTITTIITGMICYFLGVAFGWYISQSRNKSAIRAAYQRGEENANKEHEREKAELSEDLLERLEHMKESLVATYEAYEDAVLSVDKRLSPGAKAQLSLSYNQAPQIEYDEKGAAANKTVQKSAAQSKDLDQKKDSLKPAISSKDLMAPKVAQSSTQFSKPNSEIPSTAGLNTAEQKKGEANGTSLASQPLVSETSPSKTAETKKEDSTTSVKEVAPNGSHVSAPQNGNSTKSTTASNVVSGANPAVAKPVATASTVSSAGASSAGNSSSARP